MTSHSQELQETRHRHGTAGINGGGEDSPLRGAGDGPRVPASSSSGCLAGQSSPRAGLATGDSSWGARVDRAARVMLLSACAVFAASASGGDGRRR
jgi:hypothetical protein